MMAQRKNGTQYEGSYGRYERFPILMTRRLYFGQLITEMDLLTFECSHSTPLVLLVQQGCRIQRTPSPNLVLDDHGLLQVLGWLLE